MEYTISCKAPHKHFIDIQITIDKVKAGKFYLQLPAWRPGRYELQNYGRNIQRFEVFDEKGKKLPCKKVSREKWEVETQSAKKIFARYNYYCYQMDAGGCWLDDEQLYINFICCMCYIPGREHETCRVKLHIPKNYKIACGLKKKQNELIADDFYHLADSPLIASDSLLHKIYKIGKTNFNVWIQGKAGFDWEKVLNHFKKFTKANIKVFGEFPEKDYHFIYQILPYRHYHGVEHRNSTMITLGPADTLKNDASYQSFLGISSHELFHAWNALKIRPKEMVPYDLTKENYFRTGYVIEGVTTYYGDLLLARSGVFNLDQYFHEIDVLFKKHFENYGRYYNSLAESSFDLWIDGYTAGIPNRKVSIYGKGAIVALLLDLEIRRETKNKKSYDDVMKYLWKEYGKRGIGYSESDFQKVVQKITGISFKNYFDECIYNVTSIEERLNAALNFVGCELIISPNPILVERHFGFRYLQQRDGRLIIDLIEPESPADKALSKDDEILAVDSVKVENNLHELIGEKKSIEITVSRWGKVYSRKITADKKTYLDQYTIGKKSHPKPEEKVSFKKWLSINFD